MTEILVYPIASSIGMERSCSVASSENDRDEPRIYLTMAATERKSRKPPVPIGDRIQPPSLVEIPMTTFLARALQAKATADAVARKPIRPSPVTSNIQYSDEELDWLKAVDEYKRATGRNFPSYSELFALLTTRLGYKKA